MRKIDACGCNKRKVGVQGRRKRRREGSNGRVGLVGGDTFGRRRAPAFLFLKKGVNFLGENKTPSQSTRSTFRSSSNSSFLRSFGLVPFETSTLSTSSKT